MAADAAPEDRDQHAPAFARQLDDVVVLQQGAVLLGPVEHQFAAFQRLPRFLPRFWPCFLPRANADQRGPPHGILRQGKFTVIVDGGDGDRMQFGIQCVNRKIGRGLIRVASDEQQSSHDNLPGVTVRNCYCGNDNTRGAHIYFVLSLFGFGSFAAAIF